jgi:hypothetical protein
VFRREGGYWTVVFDGSVVRRRDAKGLRHRARPNATRAIRAAVANLARDPPGLGRHLAATIRTGRYCAYLPDPRAPIAGNADPGHRPPRLNLDPPSAHAAGRVSAGQRPLLATWPCTHWVELYPASDGTLTCGDPIEFTTLRWIQAQPICSASSTMIPSGPRT